MVFTSDISKIARVICSRFRYINKDEILGIRKIDDPINPTTVYEVDFLKDSLNSRLEDNFVIKDVNKINFYDDPIHPDVYELHIRFDEGGMFSSIPRKDLED